MRAPASSSWSLRISLSVAKCPVCFQAAKELQKEKNRQEELSTLNYTIQQLYFQVERQDTQIKELLQVN